MTASVKPEVCFFERDPDYPLLRRAGAEAVGTLLLMFAAMGSGAVAAGLGSLNASAALLQAVATSGALIGLIIAFGAVSGGHFNPIITAGQWLGGERSLRCTLAYTAAQLVGAVAGAVLSRVMFASPMAVVAPAQWRLVASEVVATAGLMIIVFGCSRAKRSEAGPFAVGAWLVGMIMSLPSSFANPALVVGALVALGPFQVAAGNGAQFIVAEIVGGLLARAVIAFAYGGVHVKPRSVS